MGVTVLVVAVLTVLTVAVAVLTVALLMVLTVVVLRVALLLRHALLRFHISVVQLFCERIHGCHGIECVDAREQLAFCVGEGHIAVRAHLVLNVDAVDERVRREVLASGFLEQRTVRREVRVSASEAGAQPGILVLHQAFNARVFQHVDVGMKTVEILALFENWNRLGTAGVLRVPDLVSDEQVVLINRDVVELRQYQNAVLNVEHGSRHCFVPHADVLACEQLRETALGLVKVRAIIADGDGCPLAVGSCFLNAHMLIVLKWRR